MRQRAALLRTVVQDRRCCCSTSRSAPWTRSPARRCSLAASVRAGYGWTVVLITHDIREAVFLADRVMVLTPRPATVRPEVNVDLPRPRSTGIALTEAEEKVHAALTG